MSEHAPHAVKDCVDTATVANLNAGTRELGDGRTDPTLRPEAIPEALGVSPLALSRGQGGLHWRCLVGSDPRDTIPNPQSHYLTHTRIHRDGPFARDPQSQRESPPPPDPVASEADATNHGRFTTVWGQQIMRFFVACVCFYVPNRALTLLRGNAFYGQGTARRWNCYLWNLISVPAVWKVQKYKEIEEKRRNGDHEDGANPPETLLRLAGERVTHVADEEKGSGDNEPSPEDFLPGGSATIKRVAPPPSPARTRVPRAGKRTKTSASAPVAAAGAATPWPRTTLVLGSRETRGRSEEVREGRRDDDPITQITLEATPALTDRAEAIRGGTDRLRAASGGEKKRTGGRGARRAGAER